MKERHKAAIAFNTIFFGVLILGIIACGYLVLK